MPVTHDSMRLIEQAKTICEQRIYLDEAKELYSLISSKWLHVSNCSLCLHSRLKNPKNSAIFLFQKRVCHKWRHPFLGVRRMSPAYSSRVEHLCPTFTQMSEKKTRKKDAKKKTWKKDAKKRHGKRRRKKTRKKDVKKDVKKKDAKTEAQKCSKNRCKY